MPVQESVHFIKFVINIVQIK